jgi:hypothetical protein
MVKPKRARGSKREKKRKSQATKARRKTIRERVMVLGLGFLIRQLRFHRQR